MTVTEKGWLADAETRCETCMPMPLVEVAKRGCDQCGLTTAPAWLIAKLGKESEQLKQEAAGKPATDHNLVAARISLRKRYPRLAELERATREQLTKRSPTVDVDQLTFAERVTAAIDRRARAWHADGLHFDKSLAELRGQIRKAQPHLVQLERSGKTVDVAKTRIDNSTDRDLMDALRFVKDWG